MARKKQSKTPNLDMILEKFDGAEMAILEPRERYDSAIMGVIERFGIPGPIICYDREKVLQVNVDDGMNEEEALEFYDFNTLGAWMGEGTPVFLEKLPE